MFFTEWFGQTTRQEEEYSSRADEPLRPTSLFDSLNFRSEEVDWNGLDEQLHSTDWDTELAEQNPADISVLLAKIAHLRPTVTNVVSFSSTDFVQTTFKLTPNFAARITNFAHYPKSSIVLKVGTCTQSRHECSLLYQIVFHHIFLTQIDFVLLL